MSALRSATGLSPLARGTRVSHSNQLIRGRFIPAGAGNTVRRPCYTTANTVYPRWRGEHGAMLSSLRPRLGLSPLARGTPWHLPERPESWRFIPAGAGNTSAKKSERLHFTVYPRWRGEHVDCTFLGVEIRGLSPLARGTRSCPPKQTPAARFIPAGAGNTSGWLY